MRNKHLPMAEKKEPLADVLVDAAEDIFDNCTEGGQFFGIFIRNLDAKFFFDGHEGFEDIEGVKAEVIKEGGIRGQVGFFYAQFFMKNQPYFSRDLRLIDESVHNQQFEILPNLAGPCSRFKISIGRSIGVEMEYQKYNPGMGMLRFY